MKIGVRFNQLTFREYIHILDRHKKYTDFNPLALYRSIVENNKLDLNQKIAIRDLAHQHFFKFFEFLQIKDPHTYIAVSTLGENLNPSQQQQLYNNIQSDREKILKAKRIKHRNFGIYSKYVAADWLPGVPCAYNGTMLRQNRSNNPHLAGFPGGIRFVSDKRSCSNKWESARLRAVGKRYFRDNQADLENELIDR
jgi:hypothetical protein